MRYVSMPLRTTTHVVSYDFENTTFLLKKEIFQAIVVDEKFILDSLFNDTAI